MSPRRRNILQLMRDRETHDQINTKQDLKYKMSSNISKLGLFAELENGSNVSCIQWNERGSILVSASNDMKMILWDPFLRKSKTIISTSHNKRMNNVKFLPCSYDDIVATCSFDGSSHTYNILSRERLSICNCARGRVNCLAVANDTPYVFWSASDDGNIRQYDTRISHECSPYSTKDNLVSIYGSSGTVNQARCLGINQLKSEQLAVGANDPYVRLYDRRMVRSLSSFKIEQPYPKNLSELVIKSDDDNKGFEINNQHRPESIVKYFIPGHLHLKYPKMDKTIGASYLTFSRDGQELLVNYSGEHIYIYNLSRQVESAFCNIPKMTIEPHGNVEESLPELLDPVPHLELPDEVNQLKLEAKCFFDKTDYSAAISLYSDALNLCKSTELLSNRAAAYIKRKWYGDSYAALKDCLTILKLEPNHMKANFHVALCLFELDKLDDSKMYFDHFSVKYPTSYSCLPSEILCTKLKQALTKRQNTNENVICESIDEKLKHCKDEVELSRTERMILEEYLRNQASDYHRRYSGHCNVFTDVKEANFFGSHSQFIVGGSDDGLVFIWDKNTENNLLLLKGDSLLVSSVQPHPSQFMLACSGHDNSVKLWTPQSDNLVGEYLVDDFSKIANINQEVVMETEPSIHMSMIRSGGYFQILTCLDCQTD